MANKLESTLPNMILSLVTIGVVMAASLGFVYIKTKGPIDEAAAKKELDAIQQVLPEFNSDPANGLIEKDGVIIYQVSKDNQPVGFAIKSYTEKGFSGHIEIMAGFLPDGKIYKVTVLEHKETPGLGAKMTEPKFCDQFSGKNPENFVLKVKKDGGNVDAITASTISSRAFCDALQRAFDTMKEVTDSIADN